MDQRRPVLRDVEGLRGFRWWRIGLGGWLFSPWRESKPWTRSPSRATCLASRRFFGWSEAAPHAKGSPDASCQCGLYGLHEYPVRRRGPVRFVWELDADFSGSGGLVLGVAEASGRVLLGTDGWRAQFAAPRALFVSEWAFPNPDMEAVRLRYELPIYRDFDALHSEWGPGDNVRDLLAS